MNRFRRILPLLLVLLMLLGCRQQTPDAAQTGLMIDLRVEPEDSTVGEATLIITVTDASGSPVNDASVSARGDMNHAGMVPVLADVDGGAAGEYTLPFEWTMAGDWFVEITVTLPDGTTAVQTFDRHVAASEGS
jgi:hypothetical protein